MKKWPDITCKCGNKIPDGYYCDKCGRINFGKRKLVTVGLWDTKKKKLKVKDS